MAFTTHDFCNTWFYETRRYETRLSNTWHGTNLNIEDDIFIHEVIIYYHNTNAAEVEVKCTIRITT